MKINNPAIRVRFAPSPTGALHIGGIRTALYNYLFARQQGGTFILRIEDTDQARYVAGAEAYIVRALQWCGLTPDEGVGFGGDCAPYRQSERKAIYREYAEKLISAGKAYYAFDAPDELKQWREEAEKNTGAPPKYDAHLRLKMKNSLVITAAETARLLADTSVHWVIRLKTEADETVVFDDMIRGTVRFQTNDLDDKILLKSDGMPTYHLANVVDDHLMRISHVIRGEEWLPSTPTHVQLYAAFGWEMPQFAHLPLILRPDGKGKLSKRDGAATGIDAQHV